MGMWRLSLCKRKQFIKLSHGAFHDWIDDDGLYFRTNTFIVLHYVEIEYCNTHNLWFPGTTINVYGI